MRPLISTAVTMFAFFFFASTTVAAQKIKSLCDIHYPSDKRIEWSCLKLKKSDTPQKLFGGHWLDVLHFNRMDRRHFLVSMSIKFRSTRNSSTTSRRCRPPTLRRLATRSSSWSTRRRCTLAPTSTGSSFIPSR